MQQQGAHRDDVDVELWVGLQHRLVGERLEADLVERIGGVGDELPQEDLLVGVERVDDERQQLIDLCGDGTRVLSNSEHSVGIHDGTEEDQVSTAAVHV